jgi:HAE1 family hydrophobic/amphiphilic exporter-1
VLASLLVYMVLAAQFESCTATSGGCGGGSAADRPGSTISPIGLVILVGIVDNDAIVKVDFINQARAAGLDPRGDPGGRAKRLRRS